MRNNHSRVPDFNSFRTSPGDEFHISYSSRFNPDGTISLTESGRKNIQEEINSHLVETDMSIIVQRLQFGDTSVLSSKKPMYGDFTNLPSSFAEAFDMVNRSEKAFEALPPDIKQKFDNDRGKWFASIGSPDWFEFMGLTPSSDPGSGPDVVVDPIPSGGDPVGL